MKPNPTFRVCVVLVAASIVGLTFSVNPSAARVALLVVLAGGCLLGALSAFAACVASCRAYRSMGLGEAEVRRAADQLSDKLRAEMNRMTNEPTP